jgi:hypothetical protein
MMGRIEDGVGAKVDIFDKRGSVGIGQVQFHDDLGRVVNDISDLRLESEWHPNKNSATHLKV